MPFPTLFAGNMFFKESQGAAQTPFPTDTWRKVFQGEKEAVLNWQGPVILESLPMSFVLSTILAKPDTGASTCCI